MKLVKSVLSPTHLAPSLTLDHNNSGGRVQQMTPFARDFLRPPVGLIEPPFAAYPIPTNSQFLSLARVRPSTMQNPELFDVCTQAARLGGQELLRWRGGFEVRTKAPADLVTEADLASQRVIRDFVLAAFPAHRFIGEEGGSEIPGDETAYQWVVDPLDGTTNYVHGFPHYCVSVAVVQGGRPKMGCIYDPLREECFRAMEGHGAWLNDQPIQTSGTERLERALLAVSFPPQVDRTCEEVDLFLRMLDAGRTVRRTGSAALNLAYIAAGRLDAFWATTLSAWDIAAGVVLVREAGGVVTRLDGGELDLWQPRLLAAASRPLQQAACQLLMRR